MGPWPKTKVRKSPRFTNTAIDYFRPLYIKDGTNQKKAGVWVCLFRVYI